MFFAKNNKGERISISEANAFETYYCPLCDGELMQKHGTIKAHHFAHKTPLEEGRLSCDGWSSDMSEWHLDWQNAFPEKCREVVVEKNGIRHRADVLIDKTVVEFQHSSLNAEEFRERNQFYSSAGYRVIWVFDLIKQFSEKRIKPSLTENNSYSWDWPSRTFKNFNLWQQSVEVFFQFSDVHGDNFGLEKLTQIGADFKTFKTEYEWAYSQQEFVEYVNKQYKRMELKTIYEIINSNNFNVITVYNDVTGISAKIGAEWYRGTNKKIYGYLGKKNGYYYGDRREIYRSDCREWRLINGF